ncbi:uncharacterized protein METZ01_LOCUS347586, partial [marine metagenome]
MTKSILKYFILLTGLIFGQNPFEDLVNPTNISGVFQGQATIDSNPADNGDWVAAFDEDGNCAGASELILDSGTSYINLSIYGDDGTTSDIDEGMNAGESFYLKLWDSSSDIILDYSDGFDCWYNNNGAPMSGCGGVTNIYDFPSTVLDIDPHFSFLLAASGGGSTYDLTFGFSPDATDDFDSGIDLYAPPAPPPPAFDAALGWEGDRYYTQILNGSYADLNEHVYDISLAYDTDNLITIDWYNDGYSDAMSSVILQDAFGGIFININMVDGSGTIDE